MKLKKFCETMRRQYYVQLRDRNNMELLIVNSKNRAITAYENFEIIDWGINTIEFNPYDLYVCLDYEESEDISDERQSRWTINNSG